MTDYIAQFTPGCVDCTPVPCPELDDIDTDIPGNSKNRHSWASSCVELTFFFVFTWYRIENIFFMCGFNRVSCSSVLNVL